MLKMHEIREIIKLVDESSIHQFEIEYEGTRMVLHKKEPSISNSHLHVMEDAASTAEASKYTVTLPVADVPDAVPKSEEVSEAATPPAAIQTTSDQSETQWHKIVSPMVGTFYSASEPGAAPFVKEGQKISSDTVVCILEAMKLFNEIEAEVNGEIAKILVKDGDLVEYGQPLFLVRPL